MAGREERCELVRDGLVVLGSGALLLGGLLVSNGILDGLKPMLQLLPSPVGMVGETLPTALSSVTGNWLANPTYNRFTKICARLAGDPTTQPVLWEALHRAYAQALVEIEAELRETAINESWSRRNRDTITRTVQCFREDVDWLMARLPRDPGLSATAMLQTVTMEELIAQIETPDQSRLQRDWRDKFGAYLTQLEDSQIQPGVHDRYLVSYVSNTLPTRLTACFVRELQTDQKTFQTFSHLLQASSQQTLLSLQVGQEAIETNLTQLATAIQGLAFQGDEFTKLLERVQETIQREILTALVRVAQQLGALTALTAALRRDVGQLHDDMVEQTEAIRDDIGKLGAQIRDAAPPPQRVLPTAALGPRHRLFGREAEIEAALAGLRASQTVAIYGMTGVGKTALAVEVAYQRRQELGDALGMILLRELGTIDLAGLCDAIALHCNDTAIRELPPAQKPVATRQLLASYLPPHDDRQALLIMDNLASVETAHVFLNAVRPPNLPTLITSQDRAISQEVEVSLHLHELTPERAPGEAVALVRNRAKLSSGADTAIAEVTRLLGYHPLALVIAAGQIAVEGVAPGQLARRLATASARLGLAAGNDRERSVRVALQVAWEALPTEAQQLLTRLAICPATTTTVPFLALITAQDEEECTMQVGQLVRRSLAERLPDEHETERVGLHQLVRDYGLHMLGATHDEAELALLAAASEYVARHASDSPADHDAIEAEVTNLIGAVEIAQQRAAWPTLQALADTLIGFNALHTRGYWNLAIQVGRAGITAAAAQDDTAALARLTHNTAIVIQNQGDYPEARRLYGESLTIMERLGDQGGVATTLHQLGIIAQDQGDYPEARRLYGESLAIKERLGNQSGVAISLSGLGSLARQLGDNDEARQLLQQALVIFQRLESPYAAWAEEQLAELAASQP